MTKAEETILARVRAINEAGKLAWLGTSPNDPNFAFPDARFIKRLYEAGLLVWYPYGPGWAVAEIKVSWAT